MSNFTGQNLALDSDVVKVPKLLAGVDTLVNVYVDLVVFTRIAGTS